MQVKWMNHAKLMVTASAIVTVLALAAFLGMGLNQGIDFAGGILLDLHFEQEVTIAQLKDTIRASANVDSVVQEVEAKAGATGREYIIRMPYLDQGARDQLLTDLTNLSQFEKIGLEEVSPTISSELATRAGLAVAIGAVLQLLYIAFRFQFKFGVAAIAALFHDAVVTVGLIALLRIEVNAPFIAGLLTVIGYSINDTIVVFDRIRENLALKKRTESNAEVVDRSINQVMARTVWTSITVVFITGALLVLGGETTFAFAAAMTIGTITGTYSSVFIATPIWLWWADRDQKSKAGAPVKA